jgi:hypothetical protein
MTDRREPSVADLTAQVKLLLTRVADHGRHHLDEINTDLVQTNFLLREAIRELTSHFLMVHAAVMSQRELVHQVFSLKVPVGDMPVELTATSDEIERHVNAIVTRLQFQDMTGQLVDRALQQAADLRAVFEILDTTDVGITADVDATENLRRANHLLDVKLAQLEHRESRIVCQTHMESGDIEFF